MAVRAGGSATTVGQFAACTICINDLGGVWGPYHTDWPPKFVDIRALNSMVHLAQVGYSYLGVTLDNTPVWLSEVEAEHLHTASLVLGPHWCS